MVGTPVIQRQFGGNRSNLANGLGGESTPEQLFQAFEIEPGQGALPGVLLPHPICIRQYRPPKPPQIIVLEGRERHVSDPAEFGSFRLE